MVSTTTSGQRGRHLLDTPDADFAVRLLDPEGPPSLTLRLPGDPAPALSAPDPLSGHELWRTLTPTTVLAGLRETPVAVHLLQVLDFDRLTGLRCRMSAARPATGRRDARTAHRHTFGTVCGLSTLLCWPGHACTDLTVGAARAATVALQDPRLAEHPEAGPALRWLISLAVAFPGDPMALSPLLLRLRRFEAGQEFLLPARWPAALLRGEAVAVSGAGSIEIGGGLGVTPCEPAAFVAGLEPRAAQPSPQTPQEGLDRAVELMQRLVSASRRAG